MTGLVATFVVSKEVSSSLSDSDIDSLVEEITANFDVDADDVSATGKSFFVCSIYSRSDFSHEFSVTVKFEHFPKVAPPFCNMSKIQISIAEL